MRLPGGRTSWSAPTRITHLNSRGTLPIGPWVGLGVLAAWAAAAMLAGGLVLRLRDA
jgi:ABC-2 type transport system permease protein